MPIFPPSLGHRLARLLASGSSSAWQSMLRHLGGSAAFAPTGVEIARELPQEQVLVLAPHPDDEIIGPGGTLIGHSDAGGDVTVVYLTDGGGVDRDRESLIRTRRREAEAVGELLGLEQIFWNHPDTRLDPRRAEADLRRLFEDHRPDSIYLPSYFEHHFDHYAANALLARVLQASESQAMICSFEVWDALPTTNWVVDVSSHLERKLEAMELYETPMRYSDFVELCRHRSALHYLLHVDSRRRSPEGAAEAFLRQSAVDFRTAFASWDASLRQAGSPLIAHLDRL